MTDGTSPKHGTGEVRYFRAALSGGQQLPADTPAAEPAPQTSDVGLTPSSPRRLKPDNGGMDEKVHSGTASLVVSRVERSGQAPGFEFLVSSGGAQGKVFPERRFDDSDLDVAANVGPGGPPAAKFLRQMRTWSAAQAGLTAWLNDRRGDYEGDLEVMIHDSTDRRLAWELLLLPTASAGKADSDGKAEGYLGALATVTRSPGRELAAPNQPSASGDPAPFQADGPVLGYCAASMAGDRELVRRFFELEELEDADGTMWDFFVKLKDGPGPHAMVYVACHGEFSVVPAECHLDGFSLEMATAYFNGRLHALAPQPTLAFLNACYGGSTASDTGNYSGGALRGFAIVLLQGGAAGVLAATGAIGQDDARKLAERLFVLLQGERHLFIPQALRQLRAEQAADLDAMERDIAKRETQRRSRRIIMSQEQQLASDLAAKAAAITDTAALMALLSPFMYVYFTAPRLQISAPQEGERTGELTSAEG
jgi:hypothetical protein